MSEKKINIGTESIDFQINDPTYRDLTDWVRRLRDIYTTKTRNSAEVKNLANELAKYLKKRFNLSVNIFTVRHRFNLFAATGVLNKNYGYNNKNIRPLINTEEFYKAFDAAFKQKPVGWVDLKTAKVHGIFEDIPVILTFGEALLMSDKISDKAIAAAMLHEIGHFFDSFSMVSLEMEFTKGMSEVYRSVIGIRDPESRKLIIEHLNNRRYTNIEAQEINRVTNLDPDKIIQLIVTDHLVTLKSQTGIHSYEEKMPEQSADIFPARFGASLGLIEFNEFFSGSAVVKRTKKEHYKIQAITLFAGLIMLPFLVPVTLAYCLPGYNLDDLTETDYDSAKSRVEKLKNQLIIQLKDPNLAKEIRESTLSEIASINKILATYNDNVGILTAVRRLFSKSYRSKTRQNELLYHLERMSSNKLFESASKLKNLL